MATTRRELSRKVNSTGKSEIILRLTVGRGIQPRIHTSLFIRPERFRNGTIVKPRTDRAEAADLQHIESELTAIEQFLLSIATSAPKEMMSRQFFCRQLEMRRHSRSHHDAAVEPFHTLFDSFLTRRNFSTWRVKRYHVLLRTLCRYQAYRTMRDGNTFDLNVTTFTADDITDFETFLRNEHEICRRFPQLYDNAEKRPLPRGNNTIVCTLNALRAFFNWCYSRQITDNRPFARYHGIKTEVYGTPYYITITERNIIAETNLSHDPRLAAQRDIFIFQCLVGCRISDLMRLKHTNIIAGAVEYIAGKTRQNHPDVIRVPLHPQAAAIIERYRVADATSLLPFISPQRYNNAIKRIFKLCGITRPVTVLNPVTGREEQRPINEIAASHLARRTFVGNLYKKVKDPSLVGKLSGHKDGSKAFARYRDIDEEMKRDLINLL